MAFASGVLSTNDYFEVFLKNRYPSTKLTNLVEYGKPTLEAIKKSDELTGIQTMIPVEVDSPQGLGSTLDVALTNATSASNTVGGGSSYGVNFTVTRTRYYAVLTLDAETMLAMRNDEGAFFRSREHEVDRIMEQLGQNLEKNLWSRGDGSQGQLLADPVTGTTFQLINASDAIKLHIGERIEFYDDSSGVPTGSARSGGPWVISKIDEDTGTITVTAALDGTIEINDHVMRVGDGAGTFTALMKGIPAWIPRVAESSGTFMGADRTVAVQKLQGHRQSWLGSIEETVKALDAKVRRVAPHKPKTLWVSFSNFNRLDIELGARGYRMEDGSEGKFGRPALMMTTAGGGVVVKAAPYVPENGAWLLSMDDWKLLTLGPAPHLVQDDGNTALRLAASVTGNGGDGIEIRWRYFSQVFCTCPYAQGVALIS